MSEADVPISVTIIRQVVLTAADTTRVADKVRSELERYIFRVEVESVL